MKCKNCKKVIEDNSVFCQWCGTKLIKEKSEMTVPKPVKLKSGEYSVQIMVNRKRFSVKAETAAKCKSLAIGYKTGTIPLPGSQKLETLKDIVQCYIDQNTYVQAEDSLRSYESHLRTMFSDYIDLPVNEIPWQQMINEEAKKVSPKTLRNRWGTVQAALNAFKFEVPDINLPPIPNKQKTVLTKEQVLSLLELIKDDHRELGVLLCLHGLRVSEVCALRRSDIHDKNIYVNKAYIPSRFGGYVIKETTKTDKSTRRVPIMFDRIYELLPEEPDAVLIPYHQATLRRYINKLCEENKLPHIALHGMRRTFATLGHKSGLPDEEVQKLGGWSTPFVMHQDYITITDDDVDQASKQLTEYIHY